jgi:hypothetical protein
MIDKSSNKKRRLSKNCSRDETGDIDSYVTDIAESGVARMI